MFTQQFISICHRKSTNWNYKFLALAQISMQLTFLCLISLTAADVAIIGGGLAGISAALELQKNGVPYTLLEASDRLGGRVYDLETEDYIYNLGTTNYLSVEYDDGLYGIAENLGLIPDNEDSEDYPGYLVDAVYGLGTKKSINSADIETYQKFVNEIYSGDMVKAAANSTPAASFQDFYNQLYAQFLKFAMKNYEGSIYSYNLNEGFGVPNLTSQLDMKNVRLNSSVTSIDWTGPKVKILVASQPLRQFDQVIVTVSLGVLKKKAATLFTPPLPNDKMRAIKETGFGSVQSAFLEYENPWWNTNHSYFVTPFSSQNNDLGNAMKTFFIGETYLSFTLAGQASAETTHMSPDQLGKVATSHLRTAFSNESIPEPTNVYTHNWYADPHYLGSESYQTPTSVKNFENSYEVLAAPLQHNNSKELVLFAGEHTHSSLAATVEGAFQSGRREAQEIIKQMATQRRR